MYDIPSRFYCHRRRHQFLPNIISKSSVNNKSTKKRKIPTDTDTTTTIMLNRNVSSLVGQVTLLSSLKASPIKLKKPFLEDSRRVLGDITGLFLAIFETT